MEEGLEEISGNGKNRILINYSKIYRLQQKQCFEENLCFDTFIRREVCMHPNVHSNTIYNSQVLEAT